MKVGERFQWTEEGQTLPFEKRGIILGITTQSAQLSRNILKRYESVCKHLGNHKDRKDSQHTCIKEKIIPHAFLRQHIHQSG